MPEFRKLPHPGHTWSLTQHAVGIVPNTLYGLLKCASPFEGWSKKDDFGHKITELMLADNLLTRNVRGGVPDAWRDYQQILAELGLIVSTNSSQRLTITELGRMFLAGAVGFAELVGIQALRYQYPNGQKYVIQSRLRQDLNEASMPIPETLTELQASAGIMLKPGTLLLRVLVELFESGHNPSLTYSECQAFLIPCKTNADAATALVEILGFRRSAADISQINRHARRNIQDWFKLLAKTDFFDLTGDGSLCLSGYSQANIATVKTLCTAQENLDSFWIPQGFNVEDRLSWFESFGSMPQSAQLGVRTRLDDVQYTRENYVAGVEEEDDEENVGRMQVNSALNLRPINLDALGTLSPPQQQVNTETLLENLRNGVEKRHAKAVLHDLMVKRLAERFIAQGALVEADPDSVDLFARWPEASTAIFEVKTVTARNIQQRLRSAIGQVEEYAYRRKVEAGYLSDRVIVINSVLPTDAWQLPFLTDHMKIGLICETQREYLAAAPTDAASSSNWLNV